MHFHPHERVAFFIDGANFYATTKALGFDVDYRRLLSYFRASGRAVRALYYTSILEDQEYSSIRPLVDWLDYNGFTVVTKPAKEYVNSLGRRKVKGNMSIEMAVDALRLAQNLDHLALFTGDGDFVPLVRSLQQRGKRVSVVSTLCTQPAMASDDLRRQADQFIDLADIAGKIARISDNRRRPPVSARESRPQEP